METEFIQRENQAGLATITLNRPAKRNAMNGKMIQELLQTLRHFSADPKVKVILIRGEGEHFCAGADISWMQQIATDSADANYDDAQVLADLMYSLYICPKPTIVLAHGSALGGGLGLVSACDIAIASEDTNFGLPEAKMGLAPSVISPYVIRAMGERAAHYYFLTGERFNSATAKELKLVHSVVKRDALLETGHSIAKNLLMSSQKALMAVKQLIRYVSSEKITEELARKTAEHLANLRSSPDAQEGLKAFVEKREPKWV